MCCGDQTLPENHDDRPFRVRPFGRLRLPRGLTRNGRSYTTPRDTIQSRSSPFGGDVPQSFQSGDFAGTSVSIEDKRYLVTFDLDERTRFFDEPVSPGAPPGTNLDPALFSICGSETDQTNCSLNWFFAIDNGGWIDDIELNFLDPGDDGTPVPEPSTLALLLTGVITAGAFTYRGRAVAAANRTA